MEDNFDEKQIFYFYMVSYIGNEILLIQKENVIFFSFITDVTSILRLCPG